MAEGANKVRVHFDPDNVDIAVDRGANLLQAARDAGVHIYASCGGQGVCGTCKVEIRDGEVETTRTDKVTDAELTKNIRQACQSRVLGDLTAYVPPESRLEKAVLTRESRGMGGTVATGWRFNPPLSKYYVELPPPTIEDNASDLSRLLRGLRLRYNLSNMTVDFDVVKKLPQALRQSGFKVTVTALVTAVKIRAGDRRRPRLINVEPGDTRSCHYSLAIDVGTTTVCGQLLDLNRGRVVADSIEYNQQISYGADVISRITYCQKPGGLEMLQKAVVNTMNIVIKSLLDESKVDIGDVGHVACAGNTTMIQILLGLDPKYVRLAPYTPAATFIPPIKASSIGIAVADHVYMFTHPLVASYIGGDINSGIVGAGVHQKKTLTYYVDIGTNGQIVIGNCDWMVAAACSAGPAFEGGGIKHGMVAISGAIEGFSIDPVTLEPHVTTIGEAKPRGICGSGLINIIAGLLVAGVIAQNGKFNTDLPTKRIRPGPDGYEYVLCDASETQTGKDIVITEADIDNLVRAKAALYAGCQTLTKSVGITCAGLERVLVAGAFGSHIDIESAITIGLFPDMPREKFTFIGNGSLLGARLTSFSTDLLDDARTVARMITNFELSENTDFMGNYIAALFLPHTHLDEFPSVKEKLAKIRRKQPQRKKA